MIFSLHDDSGLPEYKPKEPQDTNRPPHRTQGLSPTTYNIDNPLRFHGNEFVGVQGLTSPPKQHSPPRDKENQPPYNETVNENDLLLTALYAHHTKPMLAPAQKKTFTELVQV